MFNNLLKVKVKNKIIFSVILFFILTSLLAPLSISAVNGGPAMEGLHTSIESQYENTKKEGDTNMRWLMDGMTNAIGYTILAVSFIPQKLGRAMLKWVISPEFMNVSFTHISGPDANPVVAAGWPRVRDLANMFIVLGFVIIGLATTLRIRDYEAKKLLPTLIIVALLINFSLLICGLFIDGSNLAVKNFSETGGYTADSWSNDLDGQISAMKSVKTASGRLSIIAGIAFFNIMAAVVFFLFFFLFMARYIALWILVMLSPLAFACYVFPFTKKIWNMWWSNFFAWCIIGIPGTFFLWTADKVTEGITKAVKNAGNNPGLLEGQNIPLTDYMIPGILLIIGFIFSLKISAMGADTAISAAKWTGGKAMGAVSGAAGATGLKGLAQRAGNAAKDAATGASEKYLGKYSPIKQGTTAGNKASRLSESKKRLENIQDNKELAKIAEKRPMTQQQRNDQAAAAEILAERKAFGVVDPNKRDSVAARAVASGVKKEVFTKGRPETFAGASDTEAIEKATHDEAKRRTLSTSGLNMNDALKQLKTAGWRPSAAEIKNQKLDLEKRKITENALGLAPINDKDAITKLTEKLQESYIAAGDTREEAVAKTQSFKPNAGEIAARKEDLAQERIQKEFAKLDVSKIRTLPNEALSNIEFVKNVGTQRLSRATLEMSQDKINEIKKTIPEIRNSITTELGIGSSSTDAQIKAAYSSASKDIQKKVGDLSKKGQLIKNL